MREKPSEKYIEISNKNDYKGAVSVLTKSMSGKALQSKMC